MASTITMTTSTPSNVASTWLAGIEGIQSENLIKANYTLHQYYKARGFNTPNDCFEFFEAMSKLNAGSEVTDLVQADLRQWRKENEHRT
jgi:hypothetical protein